MPLLIVGLGNPGARFAGTRHNVGFEVLDRLAARLGVALWKPLLRRVQISSPVPVAAGEIALAKPLTYMNRSGDVLPFLLRKYRMDVEDLLILVDTLDLPEGVIRLKKRGGHAGHNGLKSISAVLAGDDYSRLYLGIGRPDDRSRVVEYVLSEPDGGIERYEDMLTRAVDAALSVAHDGVEKAMNEVNRRSAD